MTILRIIIPIFLLFALAVPALGAEKKTEKKIERYISAEDLKLAQKAQEYADRRDWNKAIVYAGKAKNRIVFKVFLWQKYISDAKFSSFDEIISFIRQNPDWPSNTSLVTRAEQTLGEGIEPNMVIEWFTIDKPKDSGAIKFREPLTPRGKQALAEALITKYGAVGKYENEIKKLIRETWVERDFTSAEESRFLSNHSDKLRLEDHVERINRLLWDRKTRDAQRIMGKVDKEHKLLFTARIKLQADEFGLDKAVTEVPPKFNDDEGFLYDRAVWRYQKTKKSLVLDLLLKQPAKTEYPAKWWFLKLDFIRKLIDKKDYKNAYILAKNHGFKEDNLMGYSEGEWTAGWIALSFLNDSKSAYTHFYNLYRKVSTPISLGRAAYWAGRAAEMNNNNDIAEKWFTVAAKYPTSFYGQLATEKVTEKGMYLPDHDDPSAVDIKKYNNNELINAAYLLNRLGEHRYAKLFIEQAMDNAVTNGERLLISMFGKEVSRMDYSITAAKEAAKNGGDIFIDAFYPVIKNLRDFKGKKIITPELGLVHSIILQESIFDTNARSYVGALGLMQLMPATAKEVAGMEAYPYNKNKLTSDPAYNITLGSRYLAHLLEEFDGSYVLSIAAYNGGPANVRKWIQINGDPRKAKTVEEVVDWIELIPFDETQNYVQRVLENLQVYRYILDKNANPYARTAEDLMRR